MADQKTDSKKKDQGKKSKKLTAKDLKKLKGGQQRSCGKMKAPLCEWGDS